MDTALSMTNRLKNARKCEIPLFIKKNVGSKMIFYYGVKDN